MQHLLVFETAHMRYKESMNGCIYLS